VWERRAVFFAADTYLRTMNALFSILVRAAFTFVAFLVIQYAVPYYFLVAGGLAAAVFSWFAGSDRNLAMGIGIGAVVFGIFAGLYGSI
jgi:hypothetical protein